MEGGREAVVGANRKFECQVVGFPPPTIRWFKNNVEITLDPRYKFSLEQSDGTVSMHIENIRLSDSGFYQCRAENCEGYAVTAAHLMVRAPDEKSPPSAVALQDNGRGKSDTIRMEAIHEVTQKSSSSVLESSQSKRRPLMLQNSTESVSNDAAPPNAASQQTVPKFLKKPESVNATETQAIALSCSVQGLPPPVVTWFHNGKLLKSNGTNLHISESNSEHTLLISECSAMDAGEYTCTAANATGAVYCSCTVSVEALSEDDSSCSDSEYSLAGTRKLSAVEEENTTDSTSDKLKKPEANFLREMVVTTEYVDTSKKITLHCGDIVEVLDTAKADTWLVRCKNNSLQVCYVPRGFLDHLTNRSTTDVRAVDVKGSKVAIANVDVVTVTEAKNKDIAIVQDGSKTPKPKADRRSKALGQPKSSEKDDSSGDETSNTNAEVYPVYVAIANYESEELKVCEGQFLEVIDRSNPLTWLVRTKPTKATASKVGWMPASYLELKDGMGHVDRRSTREVFREDIIQITDKQSEANVKRRYALTELLESEQDYISDLAELIAQLKTDSTTHIPEKEHILEELIEFHDFHSKSFLPALMQSAEAPVEIADAFLAWKNGKSVAGSSNALPCFQMPLGHIRKYQSLLKDFVRYTARSGGDCEKLEKALNMLLYVTKCIEDQEILQQFQNCPQYVTQQKPLIRHEGVTIWSGEDKSIKGKDRHLFLFPESLVITRPIKIASGADEYEFKECLMLSGIKMNDSVASDDKRFEILYTDTAGRYELYVVQTKSDFSKEAWLRDLENTLRAQGLENCYITEKERSDFLQKISPLGKTSAAVKKSPVTPLTDKELALGDYSTGTETEHYMTAVESEVSSYYTAAESNDDDVTPSSKLEKKLLQELQANSASAKNLKEKLPGNGKPEASRPGSQNPPSGPTFSKHLIPAVSDDGTSARFDCQVTGNPKPDVSWYLQEKKLCENDHYTLAASYEGNYYLVIHDLTISDAGLYTARATNTLAEASSSAKLKVGAPKPLFANESSQCAQQLASEMSEAQSTPSHAPDLLETPVPAVPVSSNQEVSKEQEVMAVGKARMPTNLAPAVSTGASNISTTEATQVEGGLTAAFEELVTTANLDHTSTNCHTDSGPTEIGKQTSSKAVGDKALTTGKDKDAAKGSPKTSTNTSDKDKPSIKSKEDSEGFAKTQKKTLAEAVVDKASIKDEDKDVANDSAKASKDILTADKLSTENKDEDIGKGLAKTTKQTLEAAVEEKTSLKKKDEDIGKGLAKTTKQTLEGAVEEKTSLKKKDENIGKGLAKTTKQSPEGAVEEKTSLKKKDKDIGKGLAKTTKQTLERAVQDKASLSKKDEDIGKGLAKTTKQSLEGAVEDKASLKTKDKDTGNDLVNTSTQTSIKSEGDIVSLQGNEKSAGKDQEKSGAQISAEAIVYSTSADRKDADIGSDETFMQSSAEAALDGQSIKDTDNASDSTSENSTNQISADGLADSVTIQDKDKKSATAPENNCVIQGKDESTDNFANAPEQTLGSPNSASIANADGLPAQGVRVEASTLSTAQSSTKNFNRDIVDIDASKEALVTAESQESIRKTSEAGFYNDHVAANESWQPKATGSGTSGYARAWSNYENEERMIVKSSSMTTESPSLFQGLLITKGCGGNNSNSNEQMIEIARNLRTLMAPPPSTGPKSFAPPAPITDRPETRHAGADMFVLMWTPPAYHRDAYVDISYVVEQRAGFELEWQRLHSGIRDSFVKLHIPTREAQYRIRAENEYGLSEPSMSVTGPHKRQTVLPDHHVQEALTAAVGSYQSASHDVSSRDADNLYWNSLTASRRTSIDDTASSEGHLRNAFERGLPLAPRFAKNRDAEDQYAIEGRTARVVCTVYTHSGSSIRWYHNDAKIMLDERHSSSVYPSGLCVLEFDNMTWDDVGEYRIIVENNYGSASRGISLQMADPPTFLELPPLSVSLHRFDSLRITCRVDGMPHPKVTFFKDTQKIADSPRTQIEKLGQGCWSLTVKNVLVRDAGRYTIMADNVAGQNHFSTMVNVDERTSGPQMAQTSGYLFEEHYYVQEVVGRDSSCSIHRVIEKCSGLEFHARVYHDLAVEARSSCRQQLGAARAVSSDGVISIINVIENDSQFVIVTEIAGPTLTDHILQMTSWSENLVAFYMQQLLFIMECLYRVNVTLANLQIDNIHVSSTGQKLKIDVYKAGWQLTSSTGRSEYNGMRSLFSAPEATAGEVCGITGMWNLGVIAYMLLGGVPCVLDDGSVNVDIASLTLATPEAKDFVTRLLQRETCERLTIEEAKRHTWLKSAAEDGSGMKLDVSRVMEFIVLNQEQNEMSVRSRQLKRRRPSASEALSNDEDVIKQQACGADEEAWLVDWFAHYRRDGCDDSYLVPVHELSLPLKLRLYRRYQTFEVREEEEAVWHARTLRMREILRNNQDIPKVELSKSDLVALATRGLAQIEQRLPSSANSHKAEAKLPLIFSHKLENKAFKVGKPFALRCRLECNDTAGASISWYKNEELLSGDLHLGSQAAIDRYEFIYSHDGQLELRLRGRSVQQDAASYKCIARHKRGCVVTKARLLVGDTPSPPGRPVSSCTWDSQVYLLWAEPESENNGYITHYRVDSKATGDEKWTICLYTSLCSAVVTGLQAGDAYRFRVSAVNEFGYSAYSVASPEVRMSVKGTSSSPLSEEMLELISSFQLPATGETSSAFSAWLADDSSWCNPSGNLSIQLNVSNPKHFYRFSNNKIQRGLFECICMDEQRAYSARATARNEASLAEFDLLRTLKHVHLLNIVDAYELPSHYIFVHDRVSRDSVLHRLSRKARYTESLAKDLVRQIVDAIDYLHYHDIAHLAVHPENIVMADDCSWRAQLCGFDSARIVTTNDGSFASSSPFPEFAAPEVALGEGASLATDIWGLGILAFIIVCGHSPFYSSDKKDMLNRIQYVRYWTGDQPARSTLPLSQTFFYQTLKRVPSNRLTAKAILNHRWLVESSSSIADASFTFPGNRLQPLVTRLDAMAKAVHGTTDICPLSLLSPP